MRALLAAPWAYPLALAAGLLMPLGLAPVGLAWAPFAGLAVIFAVVCAAPWRRAALAAYLFGLGYAGLGVYWIFIAVGEYGGGLLAASLVTPLFVALFALLPLAALLLGRLLGRGRPAVTTLLALPLAWILVEWVRSWLLTGATWLSIGYSQLETPLSGLAPVLGVYGVGLAIAPVAGALAWWLLSPLSLRLLAPALLALLVFGVGLLLPGRWTEPVGERLEVALIQGNVSQDQKWLEANRDRTLEHYIDTSREHFGRDLVIWPETAVPAFFHQVRDSHLAPLAEEARAAGTTLLVGAPVADVAGEGLFNAVVSLTDPPAFYYKRHLVPFGEYVPLRDAFGGVLDFVGAPLGDFNAGTDPSPLPAAGRRIGVSICYEVTFGAEVAEALPAAELLLNVSNDAWFGDSFAPWQHLEMARMRALETGRPMLRATNTGVTALIDHRGRLRTVGPLFEQAVVTGTVQPHQGATPYVRWGDWPVVGVVAAGLLVVGPLAGRRRKGLFR
ncbi:apolipoprotein N-acyltransferase [Sediminicurvatus halobius]|nr:apolipoprotein N-acyltransferase [Spiribacter halobius]UEX78774.1 apolipoprotein N-acyltransferase [Spiribacter halobius]